MTFCCSVLYGLLRRMRMSRALELGLGMTLAAREAAVNATMMDDTTLCLQVSKQRQRNTTQKKNTTERATLLTADTQTMECLRVAARGACSTADGVCDEVSRSLRNCNQRQLWLRFERSSLLSWFSLFFSFCPRKCKASELLCVCGG